MPRSKTQTDDEVLDVALALVREHGVGGLTFAALAGRCGLSAATLVQRFDTKAALVQRTLLHAWDALAAATRAAAESAPRTPAGAVHLLLELSGQYGGIESFGDGLLVLREDVRDPVLRARGAAWEAELTAALQARLPGVPGAGAALAACWQGSLVWWAFRPDRPLRDDLAERLHRFLELIEPASGARRARLLIRR